MENENAGPVEGTLEVKEEPKPSTSKAVETPEVSGMEEVKLKEGTGQAKKRTRRSSSSSEAQRKRKKADDDWRIELERRKAQGEDLPELGMQYVEDAEDGEHEEWVVERVYRSWRDPKDGKMWYMVKWQGWESKHNSWEPDEHLKNSQDLVTEYWERRKKNELRKQRQLEAKAKAEKEKEVAIDEEEDDKEKKSEGTPPPLLRHEEKTTPPTPPRQMPSLRVSQKEEQGVTATSSVSGYSTELAQSDSDEETDEETTKEEEEEFDSPAELMAQYKRYGPNYRRLWRMHESPLKILGVNIIQRTTILLLVRLKTDTVVKVEDLEGSPFEGVTQQNSVIVPSREFGRKFPQMLIAYYQENLQFVDIKKEVKKEEGDGNKENESP